MNLFNKITTTTALATMLIASAPMAHARIDMDTPDTLPKGTVKLTLKINDDRKSSEIDDRSAEVISATFIPFEKMESSSNTSIPIIEETTPVIITPKIQLVEEPKNTTSSSAHPILNPEQGAEALMGLLSHFLPKVQEILQETPIQQEGTQPNLKNIFSTEQKQNFANLAQEVLNDERTTRTIKLVLPNVEPSNVTGGLFRRLNTSAEKRNNASYGWYTGGGSVHNHNLATYANKGTPHAQLLLDKAVEELAEGKPYLCNTLLAQAKDFPGLKEKLEATVEKHNSSKK